MLMNRGVAHPARDPGFLGLRVNEPGSLWTTRVHHAPPLNLRRIVGIVPSGERLCLSTGNPDRAVVIHEVGGLGHVETNRAEEQQHSAGDDGEQDAIHGRQTQGDRRRAALNS